MAKWLMAAWCCLISQAYGEPVRVAAVSNVEPALKTLLDRFTASTGIPVEVRYGPGVSLAASIAKGSPDQIYLSSNEEFPKRLLSQGRCIGKPKVYALGRVALWSLSNDFSSKNWLLWLKSSKGRIAVPNPETSIYGQPVLFILNHYQLVESLRPRIEKAPDIAHVFDRVASGKASAGFVSKSMVRQSAFRNKGRWVEMPADSYPPIRQTMVLLKPADKRPEAWQLFGFLLSKDAQKVWRDFGYGVPE
ncbi:molybdate ABC transporter substrate-binding protein [Chromobacterium sp. IIBBL 290-4]|uniref:molybdate ABC transporter substrate-binding protein n=1 Tax=Chromobacterium sp. IIBBL 290-4 TaxID=2953890 RepID=UPI0020B6961B|nr:molybdate ABC transporter substrate-binding protein [Chromobacterium sp. IIBBL 290-4]UTH73779.1 molybdate ABC transporter substrate-binding protein [Chromobacterium sp. IIBBL 290-4]